MPPGPSQHHEADLHRYALGVMKFWYAAGALSIPNVAQINVLAL
jgi:hypothetical protein